MARFDLDAAPVQRRWSLGSPQDEAMRPKPTLRAGGRRVSEPSGGPHDRVTDDLAKTTPQRDFQTTTLSPAKRHHRVSPSPAAVCSQGNTSCVPACELSTADLLKPTTEAPVSAEDLQTLRDLQLLSYDAVVPAVLAKGARSERPYQLFAALPRALQCQYVLTLAETHPGIAMCVLSRIGMDLLTYESSKQLLLNIATAQLDATALKDDAHALQGYWYWKPPTAQVQELGLLIGIERCWAATLIGFSDVVDVCMNVLAPITLPHGRALLMDLLDDAGQQDLGRVKCMVWAVWQCRVMGVNGAQLQACAPILCGILKVPNPVVRREMIKEMWGAFSAHADALGELAQQCASLAKAHWQVQFVCARDGLSKIPGVTLRYSAPEPLICYHGTSNKFLMQDNGGFISDTQRVLLAGDGARLLIGAGPSKACSQLGDGFYVVPDGANAQSAAGAYGYRRAQRDNQNRSDEDRHLFYDGCTVRVSITDFYRFSGSIVDDVHHQWWKLHDSTAASDSWKSTLINQDFLWAPVDVDEGLTPHNQIKLNLGSDHADVWQYLKMSVLEPHSLTRRTEKEVRQKEEEYRQDGWGNQGDQWD